MSELALLFIAMISLYSFDALSLLERIAATPMTTITDPHAVNATFKGIVRPSVVHAVRI